MSGAKPPPPPSRNHRLKLAEGTVVAGKVRLERIVKTGGMGSVWRGHHLSLDVPVAVKFLTHAWAAADDTLTRFGREAKAAAAIRSSNVVQVLDHGVDRGTPYIIMELLDGEDLAMRLRRERRLPLGEVAYIVRHVARGLQIAHDAGLVHRDLKPENIFLVREGDTIIPKILDFGIAKQLPRTSMPAGSDTRDGQLLGTPYYMSPEQARGRANIDHRADLWALGVTAYRACVGRKPFTADVIGDVIVQICSDPIPRATDLAPDLPVAIDDFFARALSRDRDQRFQSARELAQALDTVAGLSTTSSTQLSRPSGYPVSGQPPSVHPTPGALHRTPPSLQASWGDATTAARAASASRRVWVAIGTAAIVIVGVMSWGLGRLSAPGAEEEAPAAPLPDLSDERDPSAEETQADTAGDDDADQADGATTASTASSASASASAEAAPAPKPVAAPPPSPKKKRTKKKRKRRDVGY